MDLDWQVLLNILTGGGFLAVVFKFFLDRKKLQDAQLLAERQQQAALELADEVQATKTLQVEIERLVVRTEKLETALAGCMQGHIDEARKSGMLEGRVNEQSVTIAQQSQLIAQQNTTIAELKASLEAFTKKAAT